MKNPAPKFVKGTALCSADQKYALAAFVHRFTGEHRPQWARSPRLNGEPYEVQFRDDADWLAHTTFAVGSNGRIDRRFDHCTSVPTWPNRQPATV